MVGTESEAIRDPSDQIVPNEKKDHCSMRENISRNLKYTARLTDDGKDMRTKMSA